MLDEPWPLFVSIRIIIGFAAVFFSFNVGFGIFRDEKVIHEKIKKAQDALLLTKADYDEDITNEEGSP